MRDLTIIYYTANKEKESFAEKIRKNLLLVIEELPLISVSQKELSFGKNICVGDVGRSSHNIFRQIFIGVENADTPYVAFAEADSLYPKEHFQFRPYNREQNTVYYNRRVCMFDSRIPIFARKRAGFVGAIISNREYLLKILDKIMANRPMWIDTENLRCPPIPFRSFGFGVFRTKYFVISVDHDDGLHPYMHGMRERFNRLQLWGKAEKLFDELCL